MVPLGRGLGEILKRVGEGTVNFVINYIELGV